jgi:endo-1,4-beta-D-glucanase Y
LPSEFQNIFLGAENGLFSPAKRDIYSGMAGKLRPFRVNLPVLLWLILALGILPSCREASGNRLSWVLQASWASYREHFISPEGQVVLQDRGGGTISEAQAYALLRALWAGDEATFVRLYRWTRKNLSRGASHGDSLLAWEWGQQADGSWGVLDWNTASDADLDYALALVLASRQGWRAPPDLPAYQTEARQVAQAILAQEVVEVPPGALLLAPGNWHSTSPPYLLNPSYFFPAAYQVLAQAGFGSRWNRLHADAYPFLQRLTRGLGAVPGVGLVPDWVMVGADGKLTPPRERPSHFGWEAVRLPWRVALDRLWFGDLAAAQLCREQFLPFFVKEWQAKGKLVAEYRYDGSPLVDFDSPVLYAGALAAGLAGGDEKFAWQMTQKILTFYKEKGNQAYFVSPDNYYANNWAWFGLALYAGWVKMY